MSFEEEALDPSSFSSRQVEIPEWARIRCAVFDVDLGSHCAQLTCLQGTGKMEQVRRKKFEYFF